MKKEEKYAIIRAFAKDYTRSGKKEKGRILAEVSKLTGYYKTYACELLTKPPSSGKKKIKRVRFSKYLKVWDILRKLWATSNFACGKILVEAIPGLLESMIRFGEIKVTKEKEKLLLKISASTCDRLLKSERKKLEIKGRSGTKPGPLLKHQIPVRIFTPWDEQTPGFVEIDYVAHCGETLADTYISSLDAIDIATCWTEKEACLGRSEKATVEAFEKLEGRFPFKILGVDSDNDALFINWHFLRMTKRRKITFTRSRAYRKNDQAHIEQKNWSTVRKIIGYQRLETEKQLVILNRIYQLLSDYLNFFIPTLKLVRKEHTGSRTKRIYDKATTPYQRVLDHPNIDEDTKLKLKSKYLTLNPAALLREINRLTRQLLKG